MACLPETTQAGVASSGPVSTPGAHSSAATTASTTTKGPSITRLLQQLDQATQKKALLLPPKKKKRPFGSTSLNASTLTSTKKSKKSSVTVDWPSKFRGLQQHRLSSPQCVVGIDMSLTNPGLCLLHPQLRLIRLFAFRNRIKETNGLARVTCPESVFYGWVVRTTVIEEWPDPEQSFPFSLPRLSRYETRIQSLLGLIGPQDTRAPMVVGLEHYAFAANATRGDSILKELGGILRRQLCHLGHQVVEIVPSQVKRLFCQKGDAKKKDMYRAYLDMYRLPDLCALLNLSVVDDPEPKKVTKKAMALAAAPKKPKVCHDTVPHPIEDMVDALAVALSVIAKLY